jgi:hypothetical protein
LLSLPFTVERRLVLYLKSSAKAFCKECHCGFPTVCGECAWRVCEAGTDSGTGRKQAFWAGANITHWTGALEWAGGTPHCRLSDAQL